MENASKALLIAGAILLSILLISLGIMIFTQAQDTINNSGMSKAEITAFNSQFTKYEGTQKGSNVKSLIQEVNTSNASDAAEGNGRQISIVGSGFTLTSQSTYDASKGTSNRYATSTVASAGKYTVAVTGTDSSGYISQITITKK